MNSKEFSLLIEGMVRKKRCSYMDAIVLYCDDNEIDISTVKSMVSKSLKEKIKAEAERLNMLKSKRGGVLPV
mgnify:CR=1 FL=1|jgi:hypothetical protein|tara:strand:- start:114 stop:329 length:216 start_codon:yes stop_codon:yes gene_type:complete